MDQQVLTEHKDQQVLTEHKDQQVSLVLMGAQGIQGIQGTAGTNGTTPVRGTDYWTSTDIATIEGYCDNYIDTVILGGAS